MRPSIEIHLYASLKPFTPAGAGQYLISPGITLQQLLTDLQVPLDQAKLLFVNGIRAQLTTVLQGGERVGVFPPVGGG